MPLVVCIAPSSASRRHRRAPYAVRKVQCSGRLRSVGRREAQSHRAMRSDNRPQEPSRVVDIRSTLELNGNWETVDGPDILIAAELVLGCRDVLPPGVELASCSRKFCHKSARLSLLAGLAPESNRSLSNRVSAGLDGVLCIIGVPGNRRLPV